MSEPARRLPVSHLSKSSIETFMRCPTRWRRRYIDYEYEPPSGPMILGSAIGAAENHADQAVVDGEQRPSSADVLDIYAQEFDVRAHDEVDWGEEKPGEVKDSGAVLLSVYEAQVVPQIRPVSVERRFTLNFAEVDWSYIGYLDLEEADGAVCDRKVKRRRLTGADLQSDLQVDSYLLARRAEGKPAPEFRFHLMRRGRNPAAEVLSTTRSDERLDAFIARLYDISAEINWRAENDIWSYAAPGSWICTTCGYRDCPFHP